MSRRAPGASGGRSRMPRARRATSSSSEARFGSKPTSSRSATRATIRPRRSCCGCSRRRRPRPGGDASAARRDRPPAARLPPRASSGRSSRRAACRSSTTNRTPTSAFRATACARSCCRCSNARFNPAIVDVLADEAEPGARRLATGCSRRPRRPWPRSVSRPETGVWRLDVAGARRGCRAALHARSFATRCPRPPVDGPISFAACRGGAEPAYAPVDASRSGAGATSGRPIDGPGVRLERRGQELVLTSRGPAAPAPGRGEPFPVSAVYSRRGARCRRPGASCRPRSAAVGGAAVPFRAMTPWRSVQFDRLPEAARGPEPAPGDRFPAARARRPEEAAGLSSSIEGRRGSAAIRCRSSSTRPTGSSGWPATASTRSFG